MPAALWTCWAGVAGVGVLHHNARRRLQEEADQLPHEARPVVLPNLCLSPAHLQDTFERWELSDDGVVAWRVREWLAVAYSPAFHIKLLMMPNCGLGSGSPLLYQASGLARNYLQSCHHILHDICPLAPIALSPCKLPYAAAPLKLCLRTPTQTEQSTLPPMHMLRLAVDYRPSRASSARTPAPSWQFLWVAVTWRTDVGLITACAVCLIQLSIAALTTASVYRVIRRRDLSPKAYAMISLGVTTYTWTLHAVLLLAGDACFGGIASDGFHGPMLMRAATSVFVLFFMSLVTPVTRAYLPLKLGIAWLGCTTTSYMHVLYREEAGGLVLDVDPGRWSYLAVSLAVSLASLVHFIASTWRSEASLHRFLRTVVRRGQ